MSDEITITTDLEQLSCSLCKGYLSCSPIRLLPDGTSICGLCTPSNTDGPIYRQLVLEAVLNKTQFPCRNKQRGCTEVVLFDQSSGHESICAYRSFACPALVSCPSQSSLAELHDHFSAEHPDLIKDEAIFKVCVDQDVQGVFLTKKEDVVFVVCHSYNSSEKNLRYDVRYCVNYNVKYNVSAKLQMNNDLDPDYMVRQKSFECSLFDDSLRSLQNAMILNINKFLPCLDNPSCIVMTINLTCVRSEDTTNVKVETPMEVDVPRCSKCYTCLWPPIFELKSEFICSRCATSNSNCTQSSNSEILKLIVEASNIPCRWRNCIFVGKSNVVQIHENLCQFRVYNCLCDCTANYLLSSAIEHYRQMHEATYQSPDNMFCKISFIKNSPLYKMFTVKDNEVILLRYRIVQVNFVNKFVVAMYSTNITTTINMIFEHQHCKIKSKQFSLKNNFESIITLQDLPTCYNPNDELTVIVTF